jgi:hypothetical protein
MLRSGAFRVGADPMPGIGGNSSRKRASRMRESAVTTVDNNQYFLRAPCLAMIGNNQFQP